MSAQTFKRVTQEAPKLLARSFRTSKSSLDAGHGHGHSYDHYLHAENMYEPWNMKHRKLKFGVACTSMVLLGGGIPAFAIHWQKQKAAG